MLTKNSCFSLFEKLLSAALCAVLLTGAGAAQAQRRLADAIIRLHVVGHSDAPDDQAVKLEVRDAVLSVSDTLCAQAENAAQARQTLCASLGRIEAAADEVLRAHGFSYGAKAVLSYSRFPTREYETFSLPAGSYLSLTVRLGDGAGKNWWCVVFPALCGAQDAQAAAADAGLSRAQIGWIRGGSRTQIRFRLLELWEKAREALR